ncbi:hypothetical protein RB195_020005 [Necator americanus]|uniref:Uncharacterized protein n=1 Tax=Necator americanus TaxID=51031 RepID=A0ABR1CKB3_NECAM
MPARSSKLQQNSRSLRGFVDFVAFERRYLKLQSERLRFGAAAQNIHERGKRNDGDGEFSIESRECVRYMETQSVIRSRPDKALTCAATAIRDRRATGERHAHARWRVAQITLELRAKLLTALYALQKRIVLM